MTIFEITRIAQTEEGMKAYAALSKYARIVMDEGNKLSFYGYKITDKHCIWLNGEGKFIVADVYKNHITLPPSYVPEYLTFDEAEDIVNIKEA